MTRQRQVFMAVLALGLMAMPIGCGKKIVQLPDVPATVTPAAQAVDRDVHATAAKALMILRDLGHDSAEAARAEQTLLQRGAVSPPVHLAFVNGLDAVNRAGVEAIHQIEQGIDAWAQLKAILQAVIDPLQSLITQITSAGSAMQTAIGSAITLLPSQLQELVKGVQ